MLFPILLFPTETDKPMLELLMEIIHLDLLLAQSIKMVMVLQDHSRSQVGLIIFPKLSVLEFIHHTEEASMNFSPSISFQKLMVIWLIIITQVFNKMEDVEEVDQLEL